MEHCDAGGGAVHNIIRWGNRPRLQIWGAALQADGGHMRAVLKAPRGTTDEVRSYVRLDLPSFDGKAAH
jgi:hypothetical protein